MPTKPCAPFTSVPKAMLSPLVRPSVVSSSSVALTIHPQNVKQGKSTRIRTMLESAPTPSQWPRNNNSWLVWFGLQTDWRIVGGYLVLLLMLSCPRDLKVPKSFINKMQNNSANPPVVSWKPHIQPFDEWAVTPINWPWPLLLLAGGVGAIKLIRVSQPTPITTLALLSNVPSL